jgi:8-oxo-dGTP pyrophosphatase MutT (NUDIX family)
MTIALHTIQQAAVIAVRAGRVCLVTSRSGKRWVVPKGCLEAGKTVREIALQEAWEEAGLLGVLQQEPVGSYVYWKSGKRHHVMVFVLHVTDVADDWPEVTERQRCWLPPAKAVDRVDHPGLVDLLRTIARATAFGRAPSSSRLQASLAAAET